MNIEQKRRELFESKMKIPDTVQWCETQSKYIGQNFWLVDYAWQAFNAALDAVEIHLPSIPDPRCGGGDHHYGITQGIESCRAAIESTGLGLKVKP